MHVEEGAVTEQALVPSKAMPAPDSVMRIPALGPAVMAWVGVNEIVAVVEVSLTLEARVIEGNAIGLSMAGAVMPPEGAVSTLDDILKPSVVAA